MKTTFLKYCRNLGLILLSLTMHSTLAAPITYEFTGAVTLVFNLNDADGTTPVPGFEVGDLVTGSLTYDTGVDLDPGFEVSRTQLIDDFGLIPQLPGEPAVDGESYFHGGMSDAGNSVTQQTFGSADLFSIVFSTVGGDFFADPMTSTSLYRQRTNEWTPTPDRPLFAYDSLFMMQISDDPASNETVGVRLMDNDVFNGVFPANDGAQSLTSLPDLADLFRVRVFATKDLDGDGQGDVQIFADVDFLAAVAVPEPGTLPLIAFALVGLARLRSTRK